MCKCGCNTCETKGPLLTEGKVKSLLSEGLQYHIDKKIPLFETVYRIGSDKHLALIKEARKMYSRNVIDLCEDDEALIKTHLGEFALYEGESVPLDLPMLNESKYDTEETIQQTIDRLKARIKDPNDGGNVPFLVQKIKDLEKSLNESYDYDEVAQSEFGMDYDQLGSGEKEWVRDEIDNMSMNEANSNYPDFDLNKNIRYQDTSISSGMWRYTGQEQGGKGVYRNLNNGQILAFDRSDFDIFRNNLSSHFDFSESINEAKMPTQDQVDKFFALTQNEIHYLNSKPVAGQEKTFNKMEVEPWDEYDLSNWNSLVRKAKSKGQLKEAKQDIYDKFLDNPSSPKGRAKSLILKFTKEYGDNASSMAVDRFASKNNLKPEEKYILKYITKNDISISSKPGGPDFSMLNEEEIEEAEFKGKDVSLNKPKRGGSKAYYVYVRDPKTKKIKKVSFGSGGLRAKIKNKEARNAFAARHNCKDKKDRTKAGYWSCNLPRYAEALGLGAKMNTFW